MSGAWTVPRAGLTAGQCSWNGHCSLHADHRQEGKARLSQAACQCRVAMCPHTLYTHLAHPWRSWPRPQETGEDPAGTWAQLSFYPLTETVFSSERYQATVMTNAFLALV